MKKKYLFIILAIFFCFGLGHSPKNVFAESNSLVIDSNDYRLSQEYLEFYAIDSDTFTYSNNGGEVKGNELSKAFDRNFSTCFKSNIDNGSNYLDPITGEQKTNFVNYIDITFSKNMSLNRIIYASDDWYGRGYPTDLNLYYDNGNGYQLITNIKSSATSNIVVFDFGKTQEMTKLRFEYADVSRNNKYIASAREIIFLQPETEDYAVYQNLFTDYAQTQLNDSVNTFEKLCQFEERLKNNINFDIGFDKIDRAKSVSLGSVVFDKSREFSTSGSANLISRNGDVVAYSRNTLKLSKMGTNNQLTGITAKPGEKITIFVDADPTDKLPRIRFSQHFGIWNSWLSGEYQLKLGKNVLTANSFNMSNHSVETVAGGAIYISNPYTESEQSENVRVYIEGGCAYPIYRKGEDADLYKSKLKAYANRVKADASMLDITEIYSDHAIVTVRATYADSVYDNYTPEKTVTGWDEMIEKLLIFAGVEPNDQTAHINVNLRIAQPFNGVFMYAASDHVGVLLGSQGLLVNGSGFGWGVVHELGHMMDNSAREITETTNNMWAKYNETAIEKTATRGSYDATIKALSNDLKYNQTSFFNSDRYNFLVWWYLEAWQNGYWGKLENCYRGLNPSLTALISLNDEVSAKINTLSKDEKMVFFSSVATGVDLGYYFERWGFTYTKPTDSVPNPPVFTVSNASENYIYLMNLATTNGYVDDSKQYKLWYQNSKLYGETGLTNIYSPSVSPEIKSVSKISDGYSIIINHSPSANHLGYEILEGNETGGYNVIGFTYDSAFTDATSYPNGYTPNYKIVAYDKTFGCSGLSPAKSVTTTSVAVCRIGETGYSSLFDACENATDGDVINLLGSFDSANIVVDKNLTITIDESVVGNVTISRIQSGNLIIVSANKTLTITGTDGRYIVLSGNGFMQNGAIFNVSGVMNASYVKVVGNVSSGKGTIVWENETRTLSTFSNCIISENISVNGSAYYTEKSTANVQFSYCEFSDNTTSGKGIITNKGTLKLSNCVVKNNSSVYGTIYNYDGGVITVNDSEISGNTATDGGAFYLDGRSSIVNCEIKNNVASGKGGAIYYSTNAPRNRYITIDNTDFLSNSASLGNDIYMLSGAITFNDVTTHSTSEMVILSGTVTVKNNSNLSGDISISNGAKVVFDGGMFGGIDGVEFNLLGFSSGMQLFGATNYTLTELDKEKINVNDVNIALTLENNGIYAVGKTVSLVLNCGGDSQTISCFYGQSVTLYYAVAEDKYVSKFTDSSGTEYALGDEIVMKNSLSLNVSVLNKYVLNLIYPAETITIYCLPYEVVTMPASRNGDKNLLGWGNATEYYNANSEFVATKDTTLNAIYETLLKLTLVDGDKTVFEGYYRYGTVVDPSAINISQPDYWLCGNERVESITINGKTTLYAGYNVSDNASSGLPLISILGICFAIVVVVAISVAVVVSFRRKND